MEKHSRILVAGSQTVIGNSIIHQLKLQGYTNVVMDLYDEHDLSNPDKVGELFDQTSPEFVFVVAGKSGGIGANQSNPADLMLDNIMVTSNLIQSSFRHDVRKLLYMGSSCCYPRDCFQPMDVRALFSGPVEPTSSAYATAKLAGIKLCEAFNQQHGAKFVAVIPANEFGPGDDFSLDNSHVVSALIHRFHDAKINGFRSVDIWGTGNARREFIFVDDLADACIFIMLNYSEDQPINIGSGDTFAINELAELIRDIVGYKGELHFDVSKPDGAPVKVLDSSELLALGWRARTPMTAALRETYDWFLKSIQEEEY